MGTGSPGNSANQAYHEVRVLVADDSATVRWHLTRVINETPGLRVIGEAKNGEEVLQLVPQLKPDVISMDINMPRLDGLEATRRIMEQFPTPVVVVSSLLENDVELSFQALQAGALAVVEKPPDRDNPAFPQKQKQLVKTLMAMSSVKVIRRGITSRLTAVETAEHPVVYPKSPSLPEIIAIGASAGGPSALSKLLNSLPLSLPVPVVIVQHMPHEFIGGLARWLAKTSGWVVRVASDGMVLQPGVAVISPGTAHTTIIRERGKLVIRLLSEPGPYRYQPSVDVLFQSVAMTCKMTSIGLILTGMGDDGAAGLLMMRQAGAHTFAQDKASSTVFGMANAAIERGAVEDVLPLTSLASAITKLL